MLPAGFRLPDGKIDFDCPHGIPWDPTPEQLVGPARIAAERAEAAAALYNENLATCEKCDEKDTCPVWRALSDCARNKALRGDPRYPCPIGLF